MAELAQIPVRIRRQKAHARIERGSPSVIPESCFTHEQ